jgi:hypothetical protein
MGKSLDYVAGQAGNGLPGPVADNVGSSQAENGLYGTGSDADNVRNSLDYVAGQAESGLPYELGSDADNVRNSLDYVAGQAENGLPKVVASCGQFGLDYVAEQAENAVLDRAVRPVHHVMLSPFYYSVWCEIAKPKLAFGVR